jgi:hypothetical protein
LYQELCKALGEVFRQLAEQKEAKVEEGHLLSDPVHMLKWLLSVDDCAILNLERLPQPLDSVNQRQEKLRRPSTRDQRGDLGLIWASVSRYTVRTFTTDFCDTKNGGIVSRQPVAPKVSADFAALLAEMPRWHLVTRLLGLGRDEAYLPAPQKPRIHAAT